MHRIRSTPKLLLLLLLPWQTIDAVRVAGPIVTVTLRDPMATRDDRGSSSSSSSSTGTNAIGNMGVGSKWANGISFSSLKPDVAYSIRSNEGGPFPKRLPGLKMLSATAYYRYEVMKRMPHAVSFFTGIQLRPLKLPRRLPKLSRLPSDEEYDSLRSNRDGGGIEEFPEIDDDDQGQVLNLSFSPTYNLNKKTASGELKLFGSDASRWNGVARFRIPYIFRDDRVDSNVQRKKENILSFLSATCKIFLPFTALSSLTVTPTYNIASSIYPFSLQMTGESGSKTSAVLSLNVEDPRLSLIHQLDERNVVAPEISLHTAKIMYNWTMQLPSGILRAKVDPTTAIQVSWIDKAGSGRWVTDFKLPLEGSHNGGQLAADIRVQRQFIF